MQAILIPIDNRPITYLFPQLIAKIAGIRAIVPPRNLMGSLSAPTNVDELNVWLTRTLKETSAESLLVCLDSIIYGGLIPSRRIEDTVAQILDRTKVIPSWKKASASLGRIYAQSSIMRISDNYDNTEEKSYWSTCGREIFAWSEALHRRMTESTSPSEPAGPKGELEALERRIEADIRRDYLDTRWRNFQVNRKLLDYVASGSLDFLVYSQDDSGQYGLNVLEKERLTHEAQQRKLQNVVAYSGADEVLMTMLTRCFIDILKTAPIAKVSFSPKEGAAVSSRYEGQTIGESVHAQLAAAGIAVQDSGEDLHIVIHTAGNVQGDHIFLPGHSDLRELNTASSVAETLELLAASKAPYVICDLAYANGSDPLLVEGLLAQPHLLKNLWGYAGWNTSGNTLGSAIAMASARWVAQKTNRPADDVDPALKNALFVRFADDWAYQTQARKSLSNDLSAQNVQLLMAPHLKRLEQALGWSPPQVSLRLPWLRTFEIEVAV